MVVSDVGQEESMVDLAEQVVATFYQTFYASIVKQLS
jgi:hypothetical protein